MVLNRALSVSDGKWRTLDSRGLFKATVMLSELHQGVLSDLLTARLGWGWDEHPGRRSERPRLEVTGVSQALMAEFSQRSTAIEERTTTLIAEFVAARGRQPTSTEVIRLRQQATLETRPDKTYRSLAEMTADWRGRADAVSWATSRSRGWPPWPDATTCPCCARTTWPTRCSPTSHGSALAKVA